MRSPSRNGSENVTAFHSPPEAAANAPSILLDRWELGEAMSNMIYNQQRNLKRHVKRLEVARQLNSKLKRKSARMLKVTKHVSPGWDGKRDQCAGLSRVSSP
jgi:hypothetical protein